MAEMAANTAAPTLWRAAVRDGTTKANYPRFSENSASLWKSYFTRVVFVTKLSIRVKFFP